MLKIYTYANCDTCRKATRFLKENGIPFQEIPIRETPPSPKELQAALTATGDLRKLFNTSGRDYKELDLKSRLPDLTQEEAVQLLAGNGNLVKRPFATDGKVYLIGFQPEEWSKALKNQS